MVLVREPRVELNVAQIKATTRGLMAALRSRTLWAVAGFLALWSFIPTFGMPLYYHMVDHLKFDQYFIGQLTALGAVGAVVGAFVYRRYLAVWMSTRRLVYVSIVLASAATASYLLLLSRTSAIMVYFTTSLLTMIPFLTLLSLAAAACPPQAAGFTFATMMSIANLSGQLSSVFGAYLYERVFHQNIVPLIGVSTVMTLSTMLLVPFLSIRESAHKQAY
jgi:predicted MFS family arabinose efflux permease